LAKSNWGVSENGGYPQNNGELRQNSYGKSPFLMGKSTINGHFQ